MNSNTEKISILNQMIGIIDNKCADLKAKRRSMPSTAYLAEKKILLRSIDDAIAVANSIQPPDKSIVRDLQELSNQL